MPKEHSVHRHFAPLVRPLAGLVMGLTACAPEQEQDLEDDVAFRSTTFYVDTLVDAPRAPNVGACRCVSTFMSKCTLRAAVQTANLCLGPDTVILTMSGVYPLTLGSGTDDNAGSGDLDIFEAVTIHSQVMPPVSATIDAAAIDDRVFDIHEPASAVTLGGMKLIHGDLDPDLHPLGDATGGCIRTSSGVLHLNSMIVGGLDQGVPQGCRGHHGGALYASNAQVTITGSTFAYNEATTWLNGLASIDGAGGAIATFDSELSIADTWLFENDSTGHGGGLAFYAEDAPSSFATLTNIDVESNQSEQAGGGMGMFGEFSLVESSVSNNEVLDASSDGGGGLFVGEIFGGLSEIEITTISGNRANQGGGVSLRGLLTVLESDIFDNDAYQMGGGISSSSGSALELDRSSVHGNRATSGAGLFVRGKLSAINSTIAQNEASQSGGGLQFTKTAGADLLHCTVAENNAISGAGGGMFADASASVTLDRSILWSNVQASGPAECSGPITSPSVAVTDPASCVTPAPSIIPGTASGWGALGYGTSSTAFFPISVPNTALSAAQPCGIDIDQRGVPRDEKTCDVGAYENPDD